jgi:hypothetical protein
MPSGGVKGAVPAAVVVAMLSTIAGVVTSLAVRGDGGRPVDELKYYMPRAEMEQRLGQLERRMDAKFYDLRELIVRRTGK